MSIVSAASVAVEKAAFSFDREFDYRIPERLLHECEPGKRVLVPFGRGDRRRQGIVTAVHEIEDSGKLKDVLSVLDKEPVLTPRLLDVARFMKERCFCAYYEAVKTMLPAGVNYKVTTVYGVLSEDAGALLDEEKQRIYNYLLQKKKPVRLERLLDDFGLSDSTVPDEMVRDGLLYKSEQAFRKINDAVTKMAALSRECDVTAVKLTPKQESVVELLQATGAAPVKEIHILISHICAIGEDRKYNVLHLPGCLDDIPSEHRFSACEQNKNHTELLCLSEYSEPFLL